MGIVNCSTTNRMQEICNLFRKNNTIIISAFDNDCAISFPASLNNVIGVDSTNEIENPLDYIVNNDCIVNVTCREKYVKVAWVNPDYNIVKGNSFNCSFITSSVCNMLHDNDLDDVWDYFYKKQNQSKITTRKLDFKIYNAITFPFNKEIHVLATYENLLPFKIVGYYSAAITGHVGRSINSILNHGNNNSIVKDIKNIDWESFDTLILGHLDQLNSIAKKDYTKYLVDNACRYGKNIYLFDKLDTKIPEIYNKKIYIPKTDFTNIIKRKGKLFKTNIPIICVIGTNSKQGKYSLQLYLRNKLLEIGYKVGQLGTEPTSLLFGMDEMFHCGYNQEINLSVDDTYLLINQMIWNITNKNPEVIIAGCQSGLLSYNDNNIKFFPTMHRIVFEALQPDVVILCINPFDDIEYVNRVIKTAEGISEGKVLGAVCYPIDYSDNWKGKFGKRARISKEKELFLKDVYKEKLNLKLYMLDKEEELDHLIFETLNYLS